MLQTNFPTENGVQNFAEIMMGEVNMEAINTIIDDPSFLQGYLEEI